MTWHLFGLFPVGKSKADPLIRAGVGRWIQEASVASVSAQEKTDYTPPRVIIERNGGHYTVVVNLDTDEAAFEWADKFAARVNESRGK